MKTYSYRVVTDDQRVITSTNCGGVCTHRWDNGDSVDCTNEPIKLVSGHTCWFDGGVLHRTNGPAVILCGGEEWYKHGRRHRTDGPAIITPNGIVSWWINGQQCYSFEQFCAAANLPSHERIRMRLAYSSEQLPD